MSRYDRTKGWDEFDWEREIRKDDERVNAYMDELSKFIDLPHEESIIIKSLQNHSKPVPLNINLAEEDFAMSETDEELDEEFFSNEWRKKDNAFIFLMVEKMASKWAIILASKLVPENMIQGMRVVCFYGKLLSRVSDVLQIGPEQVPSALRIALCKRIAGIINELLAEVKKIAEFQDDLDDEIIYHTKRLQIVREKMIDLLEKIRSEAV